MKRFIAGFIAFVMALSVFPISLLAEEKSETFNHYSSALAQLENENNGVLKDQDRATFIVEIYGSEEKNNHGMVYKPSSTRGHDFSEEAFISTFKEAREDDSLNALVERRISEQNEVLSQITGKKVGKEEGFFSSLRSGFASVFSKKDSAIVSEALNLEKIIRYKAVLNGFALELTYAEAKEIAQLDSVKNVYISRQYKRPEETPLMKNSRKAVKSNIANARGYDGKGRVVAILDTGIDLSHQDLKLSEEGLKSAKYSKETIEKKISDLQLWGKFGTDKVPYIYNYADRTFELLDGMNHGQHIAGTIAGNGDEENEGVVGIVPEAQILAMRVFSVGVPTTGTAVYAEAIDDAALLGADAINMSLGSYSGSVEGSDLIMIKAIRRANELGSIVAIAGGNDGYQMSGKRAQAAYMIDYSTVGTPATMNESFAVASCDNFKYVNVPTTLSYGNGKEAYINPGQGSLWTAETGFELGKEYDFVDVGLGNTDADYEGKDVTGKVVLALKGEESYSKIAEIAGKHGAIAIIISNNVPAKDYYVMDTDYELIPAYSIHLNTYNELKGLENKKLSILDKEMQVLDMGSGKISSFNSWGPTPALTIKPEITAPGGDIRSINNNGGYIMMSGTSMATPHVAGGIAAVNGVLENLGMQLQGEEKTAFIKKILMSTARPQELRSHDGKYYSVRSQGAGLMDLDAATSGNFVYLEDSGNRSSNGEAKIEFKQLDNNSLPISVDIISKADKDVTYDVYAVIQTDQVQNGLLNLNMDEYEPYTIMEKTKVGEVLVPANGRANFNETLTYDDKAFKDDFPYGYYVDGFIFFEPKNQESAIAEEAFSPISIPFLGFRGEWDDVPVIEPFIDEFEKAGYVPFWPSQSFKTIEEYYSAKAEGLDITSFISQQNDIVDGSYDVNILGRAWDGKFTDNLAISPNKDGNQDDMTFKGVFLRNWNDFRMEVYDQEDNMVKEIYIPYRSSGRKTAQTINMFEAITSISNDVWTWDGSDQKGNIVPEGEYWINVKVRRADEKNAKVQTIKKKVVVDITNPRIENSKFEGEKILVQAMDEGRVPSGIKDVFYIQNYTENDENNVEVYKLLEEDGQYVLDKAEVGDKFNLDEGYLKVIDWAGNFIEENVAQPKGEASVEFVREFKDGSTVGVPTHIIDVYKVSLVDGEESYELVEDHKALSDGRYIASFRDIPTGYIYEWEPSNEFEINENNRKQTIKVTFEKVDKKGFANFTAKLIWPQNYPGQIKIIARAEDGAEYQLERIRGWDGILFNAQIPAGKYEINIVDQYGNKVDVEGNRNIELEENDNKSESYQVIRYGGTLKIYFTGSHMNEYFFKDVEQDGENFYLKDLSKYVKIINKNTGNDIFGVLDNIDNQDPSRPQITGLDEYELNLVIPVPFGTYLIEWKGLDNKIADPKVLEISSNPGDIFSIPKGIKLIDVEGQAGNLIVKTGFVPGFKERDIDGLVTYTLVDSYGNTIEPSSDRRWDNLTIGEYTLYAESSELGLNPERDSYSILIKDKVDEEILVRWKDQKDDPVDRMGEVVIGIYGDGGSTIGLDKLTLLFKDLNKENESPKEFVYSISNPEPMRFLIPFGDYEVSVEGLYDYVIKEIFLSENDYGETSHEGNKFRVGVYKAWNEIELSLTSKQIIDYDKDLYEPKASMIEKKVGDRITEKEIFDAISIPGYSSHKEEPKFILLDKLEDQLKHATTLSYRVKVVYPDKSEDIVSVRVRVKKDNVIVVPEEDYPIVKPDENYPIPRPERPIVKETVTHDKKKDISKKETIKKETKVDPLEIKEPYLDLKFNDIKDNRYEAEILDLASRGILKGVDNGVFEPKKAITRAMLVETLMRISRDKSISKVNKFPDVNEKEWFYNSVIWAAERGIVLGNDLGQFEPNRVVTRQEVALIIARFLKYLGIELPQNAVINEGILIAVPTWSRAEVEQMLKAGIVLPLSENYEPTSDFLRDELAHALYSIINNRVK